MRSSLLHNRRFLIGLIAISALVLAAAGVGLWTVAQPWLTPAATKPAFDPSSDRLLTPAPSLEELAARYPRIGRLLQDASLGSVYKEFVLAFERGGVDAARALAQQRALLNKRDQVRITLVIDNEANTAGVAAELQALGIIIEGSYQDLIDIAVPMSLIEQFAQNEDAGKLFEQLTQLDHIIKLRLPLPTQVNRLPAHPLANAPARPSWIPRSAPASASELAPIAMEGVEVTGAAAWHRAGFTGQGIKIGVLDLGFDGYRTLLGGALPAQVTARSFVPDEEPDATGEVHGAACAEIIHAMAPDAELFLAYYGGTETGLGRAVDWLLAQGVDIISHSAGSSLGPMDGSGRQAKIVDNAVAQGVVWVNASGNEGTEHYRGIFTDSNGDGLHEFPDGTNAMAYRPPTRGDATIILNWNDWEDHDQDFDLFLVNAQDETVASSGDAQTGQAGDLPVEGFRLTSLDAATYFILIKADGATRPVTFDLFALNGQIEFPSAAYSLSTPADARGSVTVGAMRWDTQELEDFSSQGPTNDERLKPEIVAPDRVTTDSYAPDSFPGTSAAAPHVAGAAALVLSAFPALAPNDVRDYLTTHALDLDVAGPDMATGFGSLALPADDAAPATVTPPANATEPPPAIVRVTATAVAVVPAPVEPSAPRARRTSSALIVVLGAATCLGLAGLIGSIVLLVLLLRRPPTVRRPAAAAPLRPAAPPPITVQAFLVDSTGGRLALRPGENSVGRTPDNVIILANDDQVSRHHALITWDGRHLSICDLGSSNGTLVNGQRLTPHVTQPLPHAAHIRFGPQSEFTVWAGN